MSLRGRLASAARLAVSGAALAAVPAALTVDLVGQTSRVALRAARDVARAGAVTVVRGMVEPPGHRHTPRVWTDAGRVQVELPAVAGRDAPDERRVRAQ